MWNLVTWPGIEPGLPVLGVQSLNHWTSREVPIFFFNHGKVHMTEFAISTAFKCTNSVALSVFTYATITIIHVQIFLIFSDWNSKPIKQLLPVPHPLL